MADILEWSKGASLNDGGGDTIDSTLLQQGDALVEDLRHHLQHSLSLLRSVFQLFPLDQISFTFNGGKDACVVFHLARAAIADHLSANGKRGDDEDALAQALKRIKILYFEPSHGEFPEVVDFMAEVASRYGIEYTVYRCSYKEGMADLVANHGLKAVLMGVRKGDPYTVESEHLQPSSEGWPVFLRVNPILKWDFGHVWRFLRGFRLPYCCLYDQGYTSLGDIRTTIRNPALLKEGLAGDGDEIAADDDGSQSYLPAYALADYTLERANRRPTIGSKHVRKASFREMLAVALLCVGDFLSCRDCGPTSVAHELRELRCRVVPMIVIPPEEDMITRYIQSTSTSAAAAVGRAVIVLCIDEEAEVLSRRMIQQQQHGLLQEGGGEPTSSRLVAEDDKSDDHKGSNGGQNQQQQQQQQQQHSSTIPSESPSSSSSSGGDDGGGGGWKAVTPYIQSFRDDIFLLRAAFTHSLGLSEQKAQLEILIDQLPSPSSSAISSSASQGR